MPEAELSKIRAAPEGESLGSGPERETTVVAGPNAKSAR
jgi:hypothetical protein